MLYIIIYMLNSFFEVLFLVVEIFLVILMYVNFEEILCNMMF